MIWDFEFVMGALPKECSFHASLQTPFRQYSRAAPVAVKLPSLTSPLAVINHVTHGMKSSGSAAISGHRCIYMTIQQDLPAGGCVSQSLFVFLWFYCLMTVLRCLFRLLQRNPNALTFWLIWKMWFWFAVLVRRMFRWLILIQTI